MKKLFVLCLLSINLLSVYAQDTLVPVKVYTWEQVKNANPDTVYGITFAKLKLAALPEELTNFKNLKVLDLSRNKLKVLPDFIGDFSGLEKLDASKNGLDTFPVEICRLLKLKELNLANNYFEFIPECFGYCIELETIDLWGTPVYSFPQSMNKLENLKTLDLQAVKYNARLQEELSNRLPGVKILFDAPCNCFAY